MMALASTALLISAALAELLHQHEAQPNNAEICERIGVAYLQDQQLQQAAEFFRKALVLAPDHLPARKNLGTALWFLNQHDAAEREFDRVLRVAPRDPVANLYAGLRAYEKKHYVAAVARLERAGELANANPEVRPILLESLLGAAGQQDKSGRAEAAYVTYRKALNLFPDSEEPYLALSSFAAAHGNTRYGRQIIDWGLSRLPKSSKLLFERGMMFALDGNLEQSATEFSKAQLADPAWGAPVMALGITDLQRAKFAAAAAEFRKSSNLAPRDWRPHYLYALALHKSGDPGVAGDAIRSLEAAIRMAPNEPKSYTLLGQVLLAQGRVAEAISYLERAYRLGPDDTTTLYQLGLAYKKHGRDVDAAHMMQSFQAAKAKSRSEEAQLIQILKVSPR
jgi:Flp pilus assembly protein TadD